MKALPDGAWVRGQGRTHGDPLLVLATPVSQLTKARLQGAQGGMGNSLSILVSHRTGPWPRALLPDGYLGCPALLLTTSVSPSGRESPFPCPVVPRAGTMPSRWWRWADLKYEKGSVHVRTMGVTGDVSQAPLG